ncbi:MAG: CHAT domain-containing protein [Candidatus Aminicenantes bacterium]|nr:CHAT domain-containing protein [Candidatus Aminicenantes bacterium]
MNKGLRIFVCGIFFAFFCHWKFGLINFEFQNVKRLNQQYYRLIQLTNEESLDEAVTGCKNAIAQAPVYLNLYGLLAEVSRKSGTLETSIKYLYDLIQEDKGSPYLYYGLGLCYKSQQDLKKAADSFKKSIELQADFIPVYYELVLLAHSEEECRNLILYFERILRQYPKNSFARLYLGSIYEYKFKDTAQALSHYLSALEGAKKEGEKKKEGQILNMIGNAYWGQSQYQKAREFYEAAVAAAEEAEDIEGLASYVHNSGLMHCYLGESQNGLDRYKRALQIQRDIGNKSGEAKNLRNIGYVHQGFGNYSRAMEYYRKALHIAEEIADRAAEGRYLREIALCHWHRAEYPPAASFYKRALSIAREMGDKFNEAITLNDLGNTFLKIGEYSKALEKYFEASKLSDELGNKERQAISLLNIGVIYKEVGDKSKALEYYDLALKIYREIGVKKSEGVTLNNIADIYFGNKLYSQALDFYEQSLKIAKETGDARAEANRLANIGLVSTYLDEPARAESCFRKALTKAQTLGLRDIETKVYRRWGDFHSLQGNDSLAIDAFSQSLKLAMELRLPKDTCMSHSGIASAYMRQGKFDEAVEQFKKSIQVIEGVRSRIQIEEFKSSFLENKFSIYEALIDLLCRLHRKDPSKGYGEEALYFVEQAKARAFLDSLELTNVNLKAGLPAAIREEEHALAGEIARIQTELVKPGLPDEKRETLIDKLENEEDKYQQLIQNIRLKKLAFVNVAYPEPYGIHSIREKLLNDKTALLEYFIGDESAYVFCVRKSGYCIHKLSGSHELQERVDDYIKLLSAKDAGTFTAFAAGRKLHQELLAPLKNEIAGVERLVIAPDGNLHYLPFEALVDSDNTNSHHFLLEDYRISYAPSASALISLLDREKEPVFKKDLLAFADPDYSFKGESKHKVSPSEILREFYLGQNFDFHPLQYSRLEIKKITKYVRKKSRRVFTEDQAKEETIKALPLEDFRVIHFATHGLIDEHIPSRSSLMLSLDDDPVEDGFFQAREIYDVKLKANMVVLSSCQTGRGRLQKGEGVSGLARAFIFAGADSVVVSLWSINDRASAEFMGHFYKALSKGKSKEEALKTAKKTMTGSKYSHPFFWAAFVLIGEAGSSIPLEKPRFWERIF